LGFELSEHELLDREHELERICSELDVAGTGTGGVLLIQGPAGIGKTALLRRVGRLGRERGMNVLSGRGSDLERDFAYGVVRQLLESSLKFAEKQRPDLLEGCAAAVRSVLSPGTATGTVSTGDSVQVTAVSYPTLHGLYWFCSNLSEWTPLVMSVDDYQWADLPSQRFLVYLSRRIEQLPIEIVLTHRPGEGSAELLNEFESDRSFHLIRPGPLGPHAVAGLVGSWYSEPAADQFVTACHSATGGNPLLLRELLLELKDGGLAPTAENAEHVAELGPQGVSRAVLRRLKKLPTGAFELARALSLLAAGSSLQLAAKLAEMHLHDAGQAADALIDIDILQPGLLPEFVHPIVRTAIYREMPAAGRGLMHARAARLLAQEGAPADSIAAQLLATEPAGDSWVVESLRNAARESLERAVPHSAVAYLRRALAEPPSDTARTEVLHELGFAEEAVDPPEAVVHLRQALESSTHPRERAYICLAMLRALLQVGRVSEAVDEVRSCMAALEESDGELALRLEAELISALRQGLATSPLADKQLDRWRGRVEGRTPSERLILIHLAAQSALAGADAATVAKMAQQALAGGLLLSDQSSESILYYLPVYQLTCADRFELAEEGLELAARDARSRGSPLGFAMVSTFRSCLALARGQLADAEAEARNAMEAATRLHSRTYGFPVALDALLSVLVETGDTEGAQQLLTSNGLDKELPDSVPFRLLLAARGNLRMAQSRAREAMDDFTELMRREQAGPANLFLSPYRPIAALALFELGEVQSANALADESLAQARAWGAPRLLAISLLAAARLKGGERGLDLLAEALAVTESTHAQLVRAQCLIDYGAALRRAGRRSDALPPLRLGLDLAYRCRAGVLSDYARKELAVIGARPRRPVLSGIDAMTASERRVALMASDGLPNRAIAQALFVTVRTVELHLTHAYQKLGIRSREELGSLLESTQTQ
jgi:DNA-binding CsgD family transcriptional regulator